MNIYSMLPLFGEILPEKAPCRTLMDWTFNMSLNNIAQQLGGVHYCWPSNDEALLVRGFDMLDQYPKEEDDPIWVIQYNRIMAIDNSLPQKIREIWPNCKIVVFGQDTDMGNFFTPEDQSGWHRFKTKEEIQSQYWYDDYVNEYNYDIIATYEAHQKDDEIFFVGIDNLNWDIDLYIDPSTAIVHDASKKFTSRRFIWNVSEQIAQEITRLSRPQDKLTDAICMCADAHEGTFRESMFSYLDKNDYKSLWNLHEHNLQNIVNYYCQSKVALGTSSRNRDDLPGGSKGMRDWIGPLCGTPLIYDDYKEVVDLGIVPTYNYLDWQEIIDLTNSLTRDQQLYNDIVEEQKKFSLEHTLDKELTRIFKEVNII